MCLLLMVAGCAVEPEPEPDSTPEPIAEPGFAGVIGADWEATRFPYANVQDTAFALDRFWILTDDEEAEILSSTTPEGPWEATPLNELGFAPTSDFAAFLAPADDELYLVGAEAGASDDAPPTIRVMSTTGSGWKPLAIEGPRTWTPTEAASDRELRYRWLVDATEHNGAIVLAAAVSWVEPFSTADLSIATMVISPDGTVQQTTADREPLGGSTTHLDAAELHSTRDGLHLVTAASSVGEDSTTVVVHHSVDGVTWTSRPARAPAMLDYVQRTNLDSWAVGDTLYVSGTMSPRWDSAPDDQEVFLMRSADGMSWDAVPVPGLTHDVVVASDGQHDYVALLTEDDDGEVWVEAGPELWEPVAVGLDFEMPWLIHSLSYPGGIAIADAAVLLYSGPWPE